MTILDQLIDNPGVYLGVGTDPGGQRDQPQGQAARIVIAPRPGRSGVTVDCETFDPAHPERVQPPDLGLTVHPKQFRDAGDAVIVKGRYTGTYKSTGRSHEAQMCHIWRLRNGKVAGFQQYLHPARSGAA